MNRFLIILAFFVCCLSVDCQASKISLDSLRILAEQGNAGAQSNLGTCYYTGDGVTKDYAQAVYWYRMAAEQGLAAAQNNLATCYKRGHGVEQDDVQAAYWFRKAAEQGLPAAQTWLGSCYYHGYGVTKDYAEAVSWYRVAAEQGMAAAQNNLGTCYKRGHGVPLDFAQAAYWFRKAAEQGLPAAQTWLGLCYYNGYGVIKSYGQALSLYQKAAGRGEPTAMQNLNLFSKLSESLYRIGKPGSYGLISSSGEELLQPKFEAIELLSDNYIRFKDKSGRWGIANGDGQILIDASSSTDSENGESAKASTKVVETHRASAPVRKWVPCSVCVHNPGVCQTCLGAGELVVGRCPSCHGDRKCHTCGGKGGHYQIVHKK